MLRFKILLTLCILFIRTFVMPLDIKVKAQWDGRNAKSMEVLWKNPPPFVVVHHSDGPSCTDSEACSRTIRGIQNYHMDVRKWQDIGYNFLIGGDGGIYAGRAWGLRGAHCPSYNTKSLGICLLGNFMNELPPQNQLDALADLMKYAVDNNYLQENYTLLGHRQGRQTSCPGDKLFKELQTWPHFGADIPVQ